jgi:general secretion pathway protein B
MSFILDALKKSENDRQRQSGPALFEVRVAPPRPRFPPWAIAVVVLLLVNVAVIGWLMMRRPALAAQAAQPPQQAAVAQPAPPPQPQYTPQPQYAPQPQQYAPPPAQVPPPPAGYPPNGAPVAQQGADFAPAGPPVNTGQSVEPQLADSRGAAESTNPDDYAPATEADSSSGLGHARRGTSSGLPTYEDAAAKSGVPALRLDLHVYAPDPHKRFILLNMKRLGEGESLPEGVKVDAITTDGAILEYRGSKFVMDRD